MNCAILSILTQSARFLLIGELITDGTVRIGASLAGLSSRLQVASGAQELALLGSKIQPLLRIWAVLISQTLIFIVARLALA